MATKAEKSLLANLLANKKAIAPLLRFLRTIDVRGRKRAGARELEWEPKNDQASKALLR